MLKQCINALEIIADRGQFKKDNKHWFYSNTTAIAYNEYVDTNIRKSENDFEINRIIEYIDNASKNRYECELPLFKELQEYIKQNKIRRYTYDKIKYLDIDYDNEKVCVDVILLMDLYKALNLGKKEKVIVYVESPLKPVYFKNEIGEAILMPVRR